LQAIAADVVEGTSRVNALLVPLSPEA
jgi:hypothetical protein